jgi:hypothetical protein
MSEAESTEQPEQTGNLFAGGDQSAEVPSALGMIMSAGFLVICAVIVGAAIYGLARSHFWNVAPTILQRRLDR